jgi:hypothetical protein
MGKEKRKRKAGRIVPRPEKGGIETRVSDRVAKAESTDA